jgi:hypothetical protein
MKVEGICHCGKISYAADIDPEYVLICHCSDCQIRSGAPYRAGVPAKADNFQLRGSPKTYVKTARSGNKRLLAFCPDCGSALYSTSVESHPSLFMLRLGAIKQRAQLTPKSQGFCNSAMPWAMDIANIPQAPEES